MTIYKKDKSNSLLVSVLLLETIFSSSLVYKESQNGLKHDVLQFFFVKPTVQKVSLCNILEAWLIIEQT